MSSSCPPHLILLLRSTMSYTHNDLNLLKVKADKQQCPIQHGGEAFWLADTSSSCALPPAPSAFWTLQANQKDRMSSNSYRGNWGFIILCNWWWKAHPRAPEHSTYQSFANCLLLRSKNQLCVFVTSVLNWWEDSPERRKTFSRK